MTVEVVNLRDFRARPHPDPDALIAVRGRLYELPADVVRIDRDTPWGNPYKIRPFTRRGAIEAYRVWLRVRLSEDPSFLDPLRGKRLACWCSPLACHGDVLAEALE